METFAMIEEEKESIEPYEEYEDIVRRDIGEWDEWDDEEPEDDPNLDPGFSSWDDFNRYMYG